MMASPRAAPLQIGKKKSSGWRPSEKRPRGPAPDRKARHIARRAAQAREDCDELRVWSACRAARCRRIHACTKDPKACLEQHRNADAAKRWAKTNPSTAAAAAAAPSPPPAPVLSAREGAALIAASLAEAIARGEISDDEWGV